MRFLLSILSFAILLAPPIVVTAAIRWLHPLSPIALFIVFAVFSLLWADARRALHDD